MTLKQYWQTLSKQQRQELANACNTSPDYLYQIALGNRNASGALAIDLERETGGAVMADDVCPNADWDHIRSSRPAA